jgi:hypothetical protein
MPSPRVFAWLLKRGRIPPSQMALTVVEEPPVEKEVLEPPPEVALTPCDPWPRPYYLEDGLRRVSVISGELYRFLRANFGLPGPTLSFHIPDRT